MKTTIVKKPKYFPYTQYVSKRGRLKQTIRLFEDDRGDMRIYDEKNHLFHDRSNGQLKDWIHDIKQKIKRYQQVEKTLLEIEQLRNENNT